VGALPLAAHGGRARHRSQSTRRTTAQEIPPPSHVSPPAHARWQRRRSAGSPTHSPDQSQGQDAHLRTHLGSSQRAGPCAALSEQQRGAWAGAMNDGLLSQEQPRQLRMLLAACLDQISVDGALIEVGQHETIANRRKSDSCSAVSISTTCPNQRSSGRSICQCQSGGRHHVDGYQRPDGGGSCLMVWRRHALGLNPTTAWNTRQ
jgi:hypothetical protein